MRSLRARLRRELTHAAQRLSAPLRNVLDRRVAAVAARIERAEAATHEEAAATRAATAMLSESIDEHTQGLIEAASHLGARIEQAVQTLDRIEATLAQRNREPVHTRRPARE